MRNINSLFRLDEPSLSASECSLEVNRFQAKGPILYGDPAGLRGLLLRTQHRLALIGWMKFQPPLPCPVSSLRTKNSRTVCCTAIVDLSRMFMNQFRHNATSL